MRFGKREAEQEVLIKRFAPKRIFGKFRQFEKVAGCKRIGQAHKKQTKSDLKTLNLPAKRAPAFFKDVTSYVAL